MTNVRTSRSAFCVSSFADAASRFLPADSRNFSSRSVMVLAIFGAPGDSPGDAAGTAADVDVASIAALSRDSPGGVAGRSTTSPFFFSFAFLRILTRSTMRVLHTVFARRGGNTRRIDGLLVFAEGIEQR